MMTSTPPPNYDTPLHTEREKAYQSTISGTEYECRAVDFTARVIMIVVITAALVTGVLAVYGEIRLIDAVM